MNAADRRRLTPTLAIVAALLLLCVAALWLGLGRSAHWRDDAAPPRLPDDAGAGPPPPTVPPLNDYAAVWQRPLFSPDRQPEAAAGGDDAASGQLELTGVVMLPGLKMAILHDKSSNRDYRVVEGQPSRGGPVLVSLQPRRAVVESAGTRLNLQLVPGPSPAAGQAPTQGGDGQGASAIVNDSAAGEPAQPGAQPEMGNRDSADARARRLRERLEAERRRAARQQGGGG